MAGRPCKMPMTLNMPNSCACITMTISATLVTLPWNGLSISYLMKANPTAHAKHVKPIRRPVKKPVAIPVLIAAFLAAT